ARGNGRRASRVDLEEELVAALRQRLFAGEPEVERVGGCPEVLGAERNPRLVDGHGGRIRTERRPGNRRAVEGDVKPSGSRALPGRAAAAVAGETDPHPRIVIGHTGVVVPALDGYALVDFDRRTEAGDVEQASADLPRT